MTSFTESKDWPKGLRREEQSFSIFEVLRLYDRNRRSWGHLRQCGRPCSGPMTVARPQKLPDLVLELYCQLSVSCASETMEQAWLMEI